MHFAESNTSTKDHLIATVEAHTGHRYICAKCPDRKFTNVQSHRRHEDWHKRGEIYCVCDKCDKKFEEPYQLKSHELKHLDVRLKCPVSDECENTFVHKGDQKRHANFYHRDTKDFKCEKCGKCFQSLQSRAPHLKSCSA